MNLIPRLVRVSTILILLFFASNTALASSKFDRALGLYKAEKFKQAGELWKRSGKERSDNGASFHNVAELYRNGLGYSVDEAQAVNWYKRAAGKGYLASLYELGSLFYRSGDSKLKNHHEAILWWQKAAAQGNGESQLELANVYLHSKFRDLEKSREYAFAALKNGHKNALHVLKTSSIEYESLDIGGIRQLTRLNPRGFTLLLTTLPTMLDAWKLIQQAKLNGAMIHRTLYNDFAITYGQYSTVRRAVEAILSLESNLINLHPEVRSVSVLQAQLPKHTNTMSVSWFRSLPVSRFSIVLYRSNSEVDAYDFVDQHGLSNSVVIGTVVGEYRVVAGVFASTSEAQKVLKNLPPGLLAWSPKVESISEIHAQMSERASTYVASVTTSSVTDVTKKQSSPTTVQRKKVHWRRGSKGNSSYGK